MNGKKAKQLRKSGDVTKKVKKMYKSLNHHERGVLNQAAKIAEEPTITGLGGPRVIQAEK